MSNRYSNMWWDGENEFVKSETHPGYGWYPMVAKSRVRGDNYRPYDPTDGSPAWVTAANHALASRARANFEKRR